jgi:hypothetical protein
VKLKPILNLKTILFIVVGGVMVTVLVSSAGGREFVPRSGPTKDNEVGICYFSAKHGTLRRKS